MFNKAFGSLPQERIDALREMVLAKLRPLVKLELRGAMLPNTALNPGCARRCMPKR